MTLLRPLAILWIPCMVFATSVYGAPSPLTAGVPIQVADSKGGFDFLEVDPVHRRLLADHTGNGTLDIFDLDSGKLLKQVPTGAAQGVAIDLANDKYYVSVSKEKLMVIVDGKSMEKTGEVKLSGPGDALVFNSKNRMVYVGHDDGSELWVIDPAAQKVVGSISISEAPEYAIYDEATDRLFQNIKSNDSLLVIDPVTNAVKERWPTAPAKSPHGLAFDGKSHRLFCAGGNGILAAIDSTTGKLVGSVNIAPGVDQIAFDPETKRIYCASRTGVLSIVEEKSDGGIAALADVKTAVGAKTLAIDPKTHSVWVAYADEEQSYILQLSAR